MGLSALWFKRRIVGGRMRVLIVEHNPNLSWLWKRHIERLGNDVDVADTVDGAMDAVRSTFFDVMLIDLILPDGSAIGLADYARMTSSETNVVFVTDTTFFSDGSLFAFSGNARALVKSGTAPEDLAAIVTHYGEHN